VLRLISYCVTGLPRLAFWKSELHIQKTENPF